MGYYVYIHTCNDNGKKYIGVTGRNPESRWKEGRGYKTNKHFYSDILKYGWDNIEHEIFEVDSEEEMYRKEIELISFYHSNDPRYGYNHSVGGEHGFLGCRHSEEFRKKKSEDNLKRWADPEYRKKLSEAHKGKPKPRIKIKLPDGTVIEISKPNLTKYYINKGRKFEYVP